MMNSITYTMLTSAMGFAWRKLIRTGERIGAAAERWEVNGANELQAGFVELSVWRAGRTMVRAGESLELFVNWLAMRLGYRDGEVSGMVAWPTPAQ